MKKKNTLILLILVSSMASMLVACSEDKNQENGEHVWKQQTDTLKSAKDMAKKMQENLNQQQQKLDESN